MLPDLNVVKRLQNLENEIKNVLSIYDVSNRKTKSAKPYPMPPGNQKGKATKTCHRSNFANCHASEDLANPKRVQKDGKAKLLNEGSAGKTEIVKLHSASSAGVAFAHKKQVNSRLKRRPVRPDTIELKTGEKTEGIDCLEWHDCSSVSYELPENSTKASEDGDKNLVNTAGVGDKNCSPNTNVIACTICRKANFECKAKCSRKIEFQSDERNMEQQWLVQKNKSFARDIKAKSKDRRSMSESDRKIRKERTENKSHSGDAALRQWNQSQNKFLNAASIRHHKGKVSDQNYSHSSYVERPVTAPSRSSENNENLLFTMTHDERTETEEIQENSIESEKKEIFVKKDARLNLDKIPERRLQKTNGSLKKAKDQSCGQYKVRSHVSGKEMANSDRSTKVYMMQSLPVTAFNQRENVTSDSESTASCSLAEELIHIKKSILSDATTRKVAEIIDKNHERIEEMRKSRHLALSTIKDLKAKYNAIAQTKMDLVEKLGKSQEKNEQLMKELREANEMKQQILIEWENFKKEISNGSALNKLNEVNEENNKLKEIIQVLEQELQNKTKWINEKSKTDKSSAMDKNNGISQMIRDKLFEYQVLHKKQEAANRALIRRINSLEKVIKHNKEKEKRFSEVKTKFKKQAIKAESNMQRLAAEKVELINIINEMRSCMEKKHAMSSNLQELLNARDMELEEQKLMLKQKCETLEETSKELEMIRKNSTDLEEQVKTLRISIETFDQMHQNLLKEKENYEALIQRLKDDNSKLQSEIDHERDSILIKNKIIEDLQSTIKQLREKSDEMKNLLKKNESLERVIALEREEKLEMQETIEHLRWRKEELKEKVKSLEGDLLLAPQEVVKDLQKTQIVLHELENLVQVKQKEWEIHMQSLMREKEQACNVAVFATKKLAQSTNEFQKHSDVYKKLYKMLAENLGQKEKHHQEKQTKNCVKLNDELLHRQSTPVFREGMEKNYEEHKKRTKKVVDKVYHHTKQATLKNVEQSSMKQDLAEKMQGPNDFIFTKKISGIRSLEDLTRSESEENYEVL